MHVCMCRLLAADLKSAQGGQGGVLVVDLDSGDMHTFGPVNIIDIGEMGKVSS